MTDETRTYEIVCSNETFRFTVPSNARVTYAPVVSPAGGRSYGGNALRFWLGAKESGTQLALFNNVVSFRDLSMALQVRAVRKYGSQDWIEDDGTWVGEKADQVERGWASVDDALPIHMTGTTEDPDEVFTVPLSSPSRRTIAARAMKET
jgi:hypothetical protein